MAALTSCGFDGAHEGEANAEATICWQNIEPREPGRDVMQRIDFAGRKQACARRRAIAMRKHGDAVAAGGDESLSRFLSLALGKVGVGARKVPNA